MSVLAGGSWASQFGAAHHPAPIQDSAPISVESSDEFPVESSDESSVESYVARREDPKGRFN